MEVREGNSSESGGLPFGNEIPAAFSRQQLTVEHIFNRLFQLSHYSQYACQRLVLLNYHPNDDYDRCLNSSKMEV